MAKNQLVRVVKIAQKEYLQLRWRCPSTGRLRQRSAKTNDRREAERAAARLEDTLKLGEEDADRITWQEFRKRYAHEHLSPASDSGLRTWATVCDRIEALFNPRRLADVNASRLSAWKAQMVDEGLSACTVSTYLRVIRASMKWALDLQLIRKVPHIQMPRAPEEMRSRPITLEEFERMMDVAAKVRPKECPHLQRFLSGLWHSGFRSGELARLSWNPDALIAIDLTYELPLVRIQGRGQKNKRVQYQPIIGAFWELLSETPEEDRDGLCFPVYNKHGKAVSAARIQALIADVGKAANVVTNTETRKTATSHDLRRAFTVRLGKRLSQSELSKYMRHGSSRTTMAYYHYVEPLQLGKRAWDA